MTSLTDEELVARYQTLAGSADAERCLDILFQRYRQKVALWCLRLGGDRESAADLAQEVFLKAFRSLSGFRGDSKFATWLYTIARNHCFNEIKARAAAPKTTADPAMLEVADETPDALAQMERAHGTQMLRELMQSSLTAEETRVMTLHYVEELPLDAVSRLLKLENASGAKAYVVSAKRKLARAVERWKAREGIRP